MQKLVDQQTKVVVPLVKELKVSEEQAIRLKYQFDQNLKELKAMTCVVRIPALAQTFHKVIRAR